MAHAVARVKDNLVTCFEAVEDLGLQSVVVADAHGAQHRLARVDAEDRPALGVAKEGTGGNFQCVIRAPDDDARFDAIVVAERRPFFPLVGEVRDDPGALFLDAER